ncbi:hypothetical protein MAHJHV57_52120 [Mycobacterium avium subsp. hominissuis]
MRACAAAPELLEVYLERIARLDSQLRCYRVVLADRARRGLAPGPVGEYHAVAAQLAVQPRDPRDTLRR